MDEMNELFYKDAYMKDFDGVVVSCTKGKKGYEVVLDDTAFYPEGGGQPGDQGTLGDARVLDVHRKEGVVVHYTDKPLDVGSRVHGTPAWCIRNLATTMWVSIWTRWSPSISAVP